MDTSTSSSSSFKRWKYDVYLSFRGEDTRMNFTDHLYFALKDAGVNVFIDDDGLRRGASMENDLNQAIQGSKIAVVVFSENYAESRWCLDELAKIMECRRTLGQLVFPIFYRVDPWDVRNQTGSFGTAFLKHEQRPQEEVKEKLQLWRKALTEAAQLFDPSLGNADRYEGRFIREIVTQILRVLDRSTCLAVASYQVGIDSRVQDIDNYLDVGESNDVRRIGIWGMGGMGKTTVAKAIFKKYQDKFEGKSFLQNVRKMKLVKLQEQLLFDILKPANTRVSCVDEGIHEIKRRFHNRRVLVIVDDIDHMKQFEALAIKYDSFGLGSRIIITTRDQHLLKILKVDMIYKLPAMNREEAFQLLSWHAFRKNCPDKEYLQVSRKVVDYCGGLPLALEVLGSYLFERSTSEWKSALEKLKFHPHPEIFKSIKISFDKLHDYELKSIFLDVSCFFTGMSKDYVMKILDGCDLYPEIGITVLQERCLVTVDHNLKLVMHDLLRDMGREIVRSESSEPGERSRLWHHDDVIDVLRNESGTEAIQGLTLDLQESDKASFSTEAFRNMQSLRLLKLNYVNLTGSYDSLSNELRWLCWHGFPLEVIPKDFDHPNMVAIDMSYSKLIRVWEDSDLLLEKLKFLNLSHSHYLTQSPDFSKLPNLEQLILQDCKCLLHIDQSIGQLQKLVSVDLKDCKALRDLPESFYELTSLETLDLAGCSKFENLAEDLGEMASLTTLILDNTAMKSIPPSISRMKNLKFLSFCGLNQPRSTYPLPPLLARLLNLRELYLDDCNLTDVSWVKTVEFTGCSKFENLAEDLGEMAWLTTPTAIKSVPTSVFGLGKLKSISVYGFKWPLSRLPRSLSVFNTLRAVSLAGCSLTDDAIPMEFWRLNFLEHLDLQRNGFRSLPNFSGISKLQSLSLAGCSGLRAMPEVPKNLKILNLSWCFALEGSPVLSAMSSLLNLRTLNLDGCNLTDVTTSMSGLGKLKSLSVYGFKWPLSRLPRSLSVFNTLREVCLAGCSLTDDAIPMEFWRLNFLERLDLQRNSFRSLPNFSGISKLQSLSLAGCSGLRAMPEVPKNLKILNLSQCFALEGIPDLSVMSSLRELHSPNFTEMPGLHNSLKSFTVIHMEGYTSLTADSRKKILQTPKRSSNDSFDEN